MANRAGPTLSPQSEPDNSASPLRPASALRRLIAFLVDLGLVAAFHFTVARQSWLFTAIFFSLYHTFSLAALGATLGKGAMALRVQRADGKRLGWGPASLRSTAGYLASAFFLLGFLRALSDPRHRCWHDLLFGSEVVQRPGPLSLKQLIQEIDRWTEQLDTWQERVLARFKRLGRLIGLVATLTLLMDFLRKQLGRLIPAPSTGTAAMLAAATMISYEVIAPQPLRPWDQALAPHEEIPALSSLSTGDVQVTLTWESPSDLDLHVKDPNDEEIYHQHPYSASGAQFDRDDHFRCAEESRNWGAENIFWSEGAAPSGTYEVWVNYFMECVNSGPTRWRVYLKVDGKRDVFKGTLEPSSGKQLVTRFSR